VIPADRRTVIKLLGWVNAAISGDVTAIRRPRRPQASAGAAAQLGTDEEVAALRPRRSLRRRRAEPGYFATLSTLLACMLRPQTLSGWPFVAVSIAGARTWAYDCVPYFLRARSNPATAPGTELENGPASGMPPRARITTSGLISFTKASSTSFSSKTLTPSFLNWRVK
jgi:hypothetical protein